MSVTVLTCPGGGGAWQDEKMRMLDSEMEN